MGGGCHLACGMPRDAGVRRLRDSLCPIARAAGLAIRRAIGGLAAAVARGAAEMAYRRHEAAVVALLATGVLGGFAVLAWRRQDPAILERLEREPPRLALPALSVRASRDAPRSRRARARPSAEPTGAPANSAPPADRVTVPTPGAPLDLNRATVADLVRLPGVGPRLAERIVARRDAQGGRFAVVDNLARVPGLGQRKAARLYPLIMVNPASGVAGAPDTAEAREPP
jgi:competence ComEA-like helix-hairpin-helix protein